MASDRASAPEGPALVNPLTSGKSVLVVDDEAMIRRVLELSLRSFGLTVRLASSGAEAIRLYRDFADTIALILLDVKMPGLDGLQTLAALKLLNPAVRCCFMSGHIGEYAEQDLLGLGALRIFEKPFRVDELARELSRLASESQMALDGEIAFSAPGRSSSGRS